MNDRIGFLSLVGALVLLVCFPTHITTAAMYGAPADDGSFTVTLPISPPIQSSVPRENAQDVRIDELMKKVDIAMGPIYPMPNGEDDAYNDWIGAALDAYKRMRKDWVVDDNSRTPLRLDTLIQRLAVCEGNIRKDIARKYRIHSFAHAFMTLSEIEFGPAEMGIIQYAHVEATMLYIEVVLGIPGKAIDGARLLSDTEYRQFILDAIRVCLHRELPRSEIWSFIQLQSAGSKRK